MGEVNVNLENVRGLPKTHWIETELFGLVGTPLRKSASPAMHNANFAALGMNAVYYPFEIGELALPKVLDAMGNMRFRGINVTMPLKRVVIDYLDDLDEMGSLCKAVNTVRFEGGRMVGTNTDGVGFVKSLVEQAGYDPKGKSCFMIGSGGAARGVSFALARAGLGSLTLLDREESSDMLESLTSDLNAYRGGIAKSAVFSEELAAKALAESELVINATCVGMPPDVSATPFDTSLLESRHMACDVVYIPHSTQMLEDAKAAGCRTLEGYWMTIWQGAEAFRFWTGGEPRVDVMTQSVLDNVVKG